MCPIWSFVWKKSKPVGPSYLLRSKYTKKLGIPWIGHHDFLNNALVSAVPTHLPLKKGLLIFDLFFKSCKKNTLRYYFSLREEEKKIWNFQINWSLQPLMLGLIAICYSYKCIQNIQKACQLTDLLSHLSEKRKNKYSLMYSSWIMCYYAAWWLSCTNQIIIKCQFL